MLDVKDGLVEQLSDVRIVQCIDHVASLAVSNYQPEITQLAQLVRDRRRLHTHGGRDLTDRARPIPQPPEDLHSTRRSQNLHALGDDSSQLAIDLRGPRMAFDSVTHLNIC